MDLNLLKELQKKYPTHWAEELQTGDRCLATIRHPTDGSKNIHKANVIVIENNHEKHGAPAIKAWFNETEYMINWNELTQIVD